MQKSVSSRTHTALAWNTAGVAIKTLFGFVRFVLLSRWLPVSAFGLMATSQAITGITFPIAVLGSAGAYLVLHKTISPIEERSLQDSFFYLRLGLLGVWVLVCIAIAVLFLPLNERWVLICLACIRALADISFIPKIIEVGKLETSSQSLAMMGEGLVSVLVSLSLGWAWRNVWALLISELAVALFGVWFFFVLRKIWLPNRYPSIFWIRALLSNGSKIMFNVVLLRVLDQIDDLWVRWQLGINAIGIYNRAYQLADMPATIFENIGSTVVFSSYSALQNQTTELRKQYFRLNSYAFLLSLPIAIVGWFLLPWGVTTLLGSQWTATVPVVRWLAVFMALQPLRMTAESIFDSQQHSSELSKIRFLQVLLMLISFAISDFWRMELIGIAIAVDFAIGVGVIFCFFYALQRMKG